MKILDMYNQSDGIYLVLSTDNFNSIYNQKYDVKYEYTYLCVRYKRNGYNHSETIWVESD